MPRRARVRDRAGNWDAFGASELQTWQARRCTAPKCSLVAEPGALHRLSTANFDIRLYLSLAPH
jgi:hypothetical protein